MPGLGKNSPIILSQSRVNFEALIERHGQFLRWRIAKKCPCVTTENTVNIRCEKCGGSGDIYDYQREYEDVLRSSVRDNIIILPEGYSDSEVLEIWDSKGRKYKFCRCDDFIQINANITNNELVDLRIKVPLIKQKLNVLLEKVDGGFYRVPDILTAPSMIDGVYYQAAGDVIAAHGLKDGNDNSVNVLGYRRDMILVDSTAEKILAESIDYIMPFKFIVLSQNLSKEDMNLVNTFNGDAVCTFPYMYNLSENDVLTILSGSMTHKIVIEKRGQDIDDTIPDFFISQIDSLETQTETFVEGTDFVLIGTNKLHWKTRQPKDNEMMSITYRYHPTYRVAKDIPMLRTSEDQRIPRKVALKLFSAFAEAKGVNRNA